jgi:hypothetical protein
MAINNKQYIDQLTKAGIDAKEAKAKVEGMLKILRQKLSDEGDIERGLRMGITKMLGSKTEKFTGICLGMSQKQDQNDIARRVALKIYDQDPMKAANDGYVVKDTNGKVVLDKNNKPTPADHRKFLDQAQKMPNRNFGKPYPMNISRTSWFFIDGEIVPAYGNVDPEAGQLYEIHAIRKPGKGYMTFPESGNIKALGPGTVDWNKFAAAVQQHPAFVELPDVVGVKKGALTITAGYVKRTGTNDRGGYLVIEDDGYPEGMFCAIDAPEMVQYITDIEDGMEVILIGKKNEYTNRDAQEVKNLNLFAAVPNPASAKVASAIADLDEIIHS